LDIWNLQAIITRRIYRWTALSVGAGILLVLVGNPFWRAFGFQAIFWGILDGAVALLGYLASQRRRSTIADPLASGPVTREAHRLRRYFWIRTGLDVLFVAAGLLLAFTWGAGDPIWRGQGWGIVAQGGFLLVFDLFHAQNVPVEHIPLSWMDLHAPEHRSFLWEGARPAALLVHGFPGTPAEMRPLGEALQRAGWTVQGLLLPGFGPGIRTLVERRWEEWYAAVSQALAALRSRHGPVLLAGYSLGGAIALSVAADQPPDGLILLAPFLWKQGLWRRLLEDVVAVLLPPYLRPLLLVDLTRPQLRQGISSVFPRADLDNPTTRSAIRRAALPLRLLDQIRRAGQKGYEAAARITTPTLVVQGDRDELVRPRGTRHTLRRFPRRPRYLEVTADHDLVKPTSPGWQEIEQAVRSFADDLLRTEAEAAALALERQPSPAAIPEMEVRHGQGTDPHARSGL